MNYKKEFTLNNGVVIPHLALGTWQMSKDEAYKSVVCAIENGYKLIDTALAYDNEDGVGKGIKASGIKREDIFVTSKLPAEIKGYKETLKAFETTMDNLKMDYLDLYLIHAPWPWEEIGKDCTSGNIESFLAMEELYKKGLIRAIGVSNFEKQHLDPILENCNVVPAVDQISYYIGHNQKETTSYLDKLGILTEAYSPLGTGRTLKQEIVLDMAKKYNTTPASICISFCIKNERVVLPKSTHPERIKSNLNDITDISKEDMQILNAFEIK